MESDKLYGWFSAKACEMSGYVIYETPNGSTVKVTAVSHNPDYPEYGWEDKVFVGEVTKFVKTIGRIV